MKLRTVCARLRSAIGEQSRTCTNPSISPAKSHSITGGNSGIGLGMAHAVAEAGADVAIWGTNATKNAAAKAELAKTGRKVLALRMRRLR